MNTDVPVHRCIGAAEVNVVPGRHSVRGPTILPTLAQGKRQEVSRGVRGNWMGDVGSLSSETSTTDNPLFR